MPLFAQPMEELPKGMLILGRDDYEEVWHRKQNLLKKLGFLDIAPIKALQYGYEI